MKTLNELKKDVIMYHDKGINCAQSTALSLSDYVDIDKKDIYSLTEAFGAGMGNHFGTCGAAVGALFIISSLASSGTIEIPTKSDTYKLSSEFLDKFKKRTGSYYCFEIKGEDKEVVEPLVPCTTAMEEAVEIAYNMIQEKNLA
ncbi:MAG: C_GCAxxG_C_C family protein [Spirochaetaceae bacterium]|nr:C_GCAxxG_C_C family protein [Spirochaetaceae bacterium]